MKRFLALMTAGIMVCGACLVVSAEESSSVSGNSISANSASAGAGGGGGSSSGSSVKAEEAALAAAFAAEVGATGVSAEVYTAALDAGLTVSEYISNSIVEVPGLDNVTPVGQGGKILLDGKLCNVTFSMAKPLPAHVNAAKAQAAALGGNVLNVVNIQANVSFGTASVNFYMPGVKTGQNIQVYRYANGQWTSLNVAEVRNDHVVVDMTSLGVFAFIQVQ